jgi:hypothetical protein
MLALFVLTGTLRAQFYPNPNPVLDCMRRASVLTNTPMASISARLRGGRDNGNDVIWWDARQSNGRIVSGFCEAGPRDGRTVRLGINQKDSGNANRVYRITPGDAERVCRKEARARFSPGNGLISAMVQRNISTKSTYLVEWWYPSPSLVGTIRDGRCEVDSSTGILLNFDVSNSW